MYLQPRGDLRRSLTVAQLLDIVGAREVFSDDLLSMHLTYGAIEGSQRLPDRDRGTLQPAGPADVLVTHGAIGANALVHQALVEPGDQVVALVPTYQQHYSIPPRSAPMSACCVCAGERLLARPR